MASDSSATRESYRFATTVDADDDAELTVEMQDPATVEDVRVRFYAGPRLDVSARPYVEHNRRQRTDRVDLINFPDDPSAKDAVDGEDDDFGFDVSEPVDAGDVVGVEFENVNPDYDYPVTVDVIVDFEGGQSRPLGSVIDRIRGWL